MHVSFNTSANKRTPNSAHVVLEYLCGQLYLVIYDSDTDMDGPYNDIVLF